MLNPAESIVVGSVFGIGALLLATSLRGVRVISPRSGVSSKRSVDDTALVEGLAVWVEQLRDAVLASSGLEQAVVATSATAPMAVRPAIQYVASELGLMPAATAYRHLADVVPVPVADLVAAVLVVATEQQVRDVAGLLAHLAECCRDEIRMRQRIWVSRARTRTAMRIIVFVVVAFPLGLLLLDPGYLSPYGRPDGLPVLVVVVASVIGGLLGMRSLAQVAVPDRLVGLGSR